jgi:MSHA biogenesis protein MshP
MRLDRGFAAITALFVLVVLAGLGVALVTIFGGQQRSQANDIQGMRAYQAARAGIEYGLYQALQNNSCGTTTFALGDLLTGFSVKVACTGGTTYTDTGTVKIYQVTATACSSGACPAGPADGYVERELRASACSGDC